MPASVEIHCAACGAALASAMNPCHKCGSANLVMDVEPEGIELTSELGSLGMASDSIDPATGARIVRNQSPSGTVSTAILGPGDQVGITIAGPPEVGRAGQPRALDALQGVLVAQGHQVTYLPGARDDHGEDALVDIDGERLTVQLVTVPASPDLWRAAASTPSASTIQPVTGAAEWLRSAIEAKTAATSPAARARTILGLDAAHAGALATPEVVAAYAAMAPTQVLENGWRAVALLGPTSSTCTILR